MSASHSVAFWGLNVPAGDEPTPVYSELPGIDTMRITMAAIDPTAKPLEADQPKFATLKLIRRRLDVDDYDDSEEGSDEDSDDEEEVAKLQKKSKALTKEAAAKKAQKAAEQNAMEVDEDKENDEDEDEDEDSEDDEDMEPFEVEEFIICTLDPAKQYQQTLDIVIGEDEEAFFKVSGNFDVSLTGNYIVPAGKGAHDHDHDHSDDEDDYDYSPDEDEILRGMNGESDEESEDELDNLENPRITEVDSEDEKPAEKPKAEAKPSKAEKKKNLKRAVEEEKTEEPKLSKKQLKKLKANDGKAVDASAASPDKKKVQFAKPIEQGSTNSKKDAKATTKAEKPEKASSSTKVVQGVTIEDKKVGNGAAAKNGSKLGMRYIGKLTNGKVFDSNTKGKPFTFRLGKGEVIKGWDVGLVGMQVGGERRITIPANMAYGKKAIPGIPANSTLVFDVKLLEVK